MSRQGNGAEPPCQDQLPALDACGAAELYQRRYAARSSKIQTRFCGTLPAELFEVLEQILGDSDAAIVVSQRYGEQESFVVLRYSDWDSIERSLVE